MLDVYSSTLPWKQQLNAAVIGRHTADALAPRINEQTRAIVASNNALSREFGDGFNALENTLVWEFGNIADSIEQLRAEFSYGVSLLVAELQVQNETLNNILDELDHIHRTLRTPVQTRAQEHFRNGYQMLGRKLIKEALDHLNRGIDEYDVDFLAQYHLGLLYLYGQDDDGNVIDLTAAEQHFRLSARYSRTEIGELDEARRYCGEALFHASVASYAQAGELRRAGNTNEGYVKLQDAIDLAKDSVGVYEELAEAWYHLSKYHALVGDAGLVAQALREAVHRDYRYLIKASLDEDFDDARTDVDGLAEEMRREVERVAGLAVARLDGWWEEIEDLLPSGAWPQPEADDLIQGMRKRSGEIRDVAKGGTYVDFRHALEIFDTLWDRDLDSLLHQTFGELLTDQMIQVTAHAQRAHPHLDSGAFNDNMTLWTPGLL